MFCHKKCNDAFCFFLEKRDRIEIVTTKIKGNHMANKRVRVAVTGAAGQIGYALLFRIEIGRAHV